MKKNNNTDPQEKTFMQHKSTALFHTQKRTLSTSKSTTNKLHSNLDTDSLLSVTQNTIDPHKELNLTNSIKKDDYGNLLYRKQRDIHHTTKKIHKGVTSKDWHRVYSGDVNKSFQASYQVYT